MAGNPLEMVTQLQTIIKELNTLPPAPVILGAVSRKVQQAICDEVKRRGPSARYLALMAERGFDEEFARKLHAATFELETGANA